MSHLLPLYSASALAAVALISATWQGGLLAICAAGMMRVLRGISAGVRSGIWVAVFAVAVGLHFVPAAGGPSGGAEGLHAVHAAPLWSLGIVGLWLGFSVLRGVQFALGVVSLRRMVRRATPVDVGAMPHIARRYSVCVSVDVDRPSVLGFFSPRILLPPGLLEQLTAGELQQVLLHETEHLRRSDDWINLLQKLALVVFPLNPALLWIERRICLERELACDDRVLAGDERMAGARKAYATCLVQLAEHSMVHRGVSLALGVLGVVRGRRTELSLRVERILRRPEAGMSVAASRFVTAALLVGLGAGSLALARAPQLVSFAPEPRPEAAEQARAFSGEARGGGMSMSGGVQALLVRAVVPAAQAVSGPRSANGFGSVKRVAQRRSIAGHGRVRKAPQMDAADWRTVEAQPRFVLTFTSEELPSRDAVQRVQQVQPIFVPAIQRGAAAYAAFATPGGWIIIQL